MGLAPRGLCWRNFVVAVTLVRLVEVGGDTDSDAPLDDEHRRSARSALPDALPFVVTSVGLDVAPPVALELHQAATAPLRDRIGTLESEVGRLKAAVAR